MSEWKTIEGTDKGEVRLYALSTCGWCKKTKKFLKKLGVKHSYIDVDRLNKEKKSIIENEVSKWNPMGSYPTLVIQDEKCIVGYDPKKIREELE